MLYLSVKTKMAVAISIMITVLLAIAALSARVYLEREQKKMISNQQFTMVTAIADHLDGELLTAQAALSAVASTMTPELVADPVKVNTFLAGRPDILVMFDNGVVLFSSAGKLIAGRLYGPALLPLALAAVYSLRRQSLPVIAGGGVYRKADGEALQAAGAVAVQLDSVLWL